MEKGKFWLVLDPRTQSFTYWKSEGDANYEANKLAHNNPHYHFVVLESLHAYVVDSPVKKVEADEILYGEIEF